MTANVKILVNARPDVLRVSNAALRYHPASEAPGRGTTNATKGSSAQKAVWILDRNGAPQRVAITTGDTDGALTEVTSGPLRDGDRAIVAALSSTAASGGSPGRAGGRGPAF